MTRHHSLPAVRVESNPERVFCISLLLPGFALERMHLKSTTSGSFPEATFL